MYAVVSSFSKRRIYACWDSVLSQRAIDPAMHQGHLLFEVSGGVERWALE
jgi:hypothetical protein